MNVQTTMMQLRLGLTREIESPAAKVNTDLKPSSNMVSSETSYTITLFKTTSPCVISAGAARETLFEGKADYCMIVCE
jgi:hypothetical protein